MDQKTFAHVCMHAFVEEYVFPETIFYGGSIYQKIRPGYGLMDG